MKHIPILFSTEMVKAIEKGTKTQTRRTKGLQKITNHYFQSLVHHATGKFTFVKNGNYSPREDDIIEVKCPYGQVGDVLWVRESFIKDGNSYLHKAQHTIVGNHIKWKPSIHMPKEACRLFLKITDIRVERLQDINDNDAKLEGIVWNPGIEWICEPPLITNAYIALFKKLWQSINGEESWNSNPWVWVISFEKTDKPENFL